jgi:hypothetical protein
MPNKTNRRTIQAFLKAVGAAWDVTIFAVSWVGHVFGLDEGVEVFGGD